MTETIFAEAGFRPVGTWPFWMRETQTCLSSTFQMEKETKNTIRYAEVAEGQPPVIGTLYVQKWAVKGTPQKLMVTIDIAEEETK